MISKVFKAYDVRALYPDPLSEPVARKIGFAAGRYLASLRSADQASNPKMNQVVVGRDMRPHSPSLAAALIEGLRASGIDVLDLGMVDTSFIYYAINHLGCLGGIQTTASHNPVDYNGFKFSGPHATPIGAESGLNAIRDIAAALGDEPMTPKGRLEPCDLWNGYKTHVMQFLKLKRPLKVAVDASNGMAGVFMPRLFDGVPNLDIIPMNYTIGQGFAHDPNPLVPENMAPVQTAVRDQGCDLGVCFDGDADRCMLTDEQGTIIGCDLLGALFGQYFLKQSPGAVVAYDLRSSRGLPESVSAAGGKPMRGRVGHVNMKKLMRENDGVFGAELSGHMYYKDNFYTDSGVMTFALAMTILSQSDQPLSALIAPLNPYAQSGEINFKVEDKQAAMDGIRGKYADRATFDDLDGVTADCWDAEGWWVNVRASNTEPMLRLNLEGRDAAIRDKMLAEITPMLGTPLVGH